MRIQFIGATGTVTGSKFLLTEGRKNYLLDCGLFQGLKLLRLRNWNPLPIKPKSIDAVILTHAHIDHSGYIPLLIKNGFRGPVYATKATRALCQVLLPDSGHLQEEDAAYENRHRLSKHSPALPLYTEEDAIESLRSFESIPWNKEVRLSRHFSFEFIPAGHILGAGLVRVSSNGTRVLFSGDLGRPAEIIMPPPSDPPPSDYLVLESTYGGRTHPKEDPSEALGLLINRTIKRGGIVLIPAFAVGRAQEVLHLITQLKKSRLIPEIPVYLNSPMAIEATRIFRDFAGEHTIPPEQCEEIFSAVRFVTTVEESKRLNSIREPAVIISASGMATGGRILHHLKSLAPDPRNLILFVGYQAAGTRGEAMIRGAEEIKIHGLQIPIRAEVRSIDTLSAHADQGEILAWLRRFPRPPKRTFLVHGEPLASEALRRQIEENLHWNCEIPDYLQSFDLT